MTRTGIVFIVLNVLLSVVFFAAVSPAMKKRQTVQTAIAGLHTALPQAVHHRIQ